MAMRSKSFYSAMSSYFGAVGATKKQFVLKKDYPDFIDGMDCIRKMDNAVKYRYRKAEEKTKKIDKIVTALLIVNLLIFVSLVPEAYFPIFLVTHFIIMGYGVLDKTFLKKRRDEKISFSFRQRAWF